MTVQSDTFCPAPWMTFYVEPSGRVDMCCISSANLGTLHDRSLADMMKSDRLIEIKQMMMDNRPVSECRACQEVDVLQQRFVRQFGGRSHADYQDINAFKLKYLDLRWNNTCNYACIYCGPELSSLWAQIKNAKQPKISHVRQDMIDMVLENVSTLEEVYLAGGEPLMLKENLTILSRLYDVNPSCKILVNTNLSVIDGNEVFDMLCKFENVHWQISAEAIRDQYEYLRWPGDWHTFDRNLQSLAQAKKPSNDIAFNLVWLNLNGLALWDYVDHLVNTGIDIAKVSILPYNMDNWPGPWHLKHMPKPYLESVRQRMDNKKYYRVHTYQQNIEFLDKYISDPNHAADLDQVISQLQAFDQARNLDSRAVFPTIYSYTQS